MRLKLSIVPNAEPNKDSVAHIVVLTDEDASAFNKTKGWIGQADLVERYLPPGFFVVSIRKIVKGQVET